MTSKTPIPSQEAQSMAAMFKQMAEHGGGPAHPMQMEIGKTDDGQPYMWFTVGMTKREKIAAMVMQGFCSDSEVNSSPPDEMAENAVRCADALLERLKK